MVTYAVALACLGLGTIAAGEVIAVRSSDAAPYVAATEALRRKLESDGYRLQSIALKDFDAQAAQKALASTTMSFVAVGSEAAVALHQRIPPSHRLVYCMVADPGGLGLSAGRATHGIDVTVPVVAQFALIAEALPKARTIGLLYRSDSKDGALITQAAKAALPAGWTLEAVAANEFGSAAKAIDSLLERKLDIVWTAPDASLYDQGVVRSLLLGAVRRRIPVFGYSQAFVKAGALLGVSVDSQVQGRQAATMLEILCEGKLAPQLVQPAEFDVAVNLIVAERIAVSLPEKLIQRARVVVKGKE